MKPHRSQYWLNREAVDGPEFAGEVRAICTLYHPAQEWLERGVHLISTDEKTGIQALARIHPDRAPPPAS